MVTYARPTFTQILASIQADINSNLPGVDARLRRSVLNVLSYMEAGVAQGLYGYIAFIALQVFPDTATGDYLNRWATIFGVQRHSAVSAAGNIVCTGIDATLIPAGTQLQRSDLVVFTTDANATINMGTVTVPVTAVVPGSNGNTTASSVLTFTSPVSGIDSTATVDGSGLSGGTDIESDDDLRIRLLARISAPPQGGAAIDYVNWAEQVAGVTRAWCVPQGSGSPNVKVYFMMDDTYSDGIPLSGDVTTVQDYMDPLIPVTAVLTVAAPVATPIDFTIHLIDNDSSAIRASVEANLQQMIIRDSGPGTTIYLSRIIETINTSDNVFASTVTVPSSDTTITSDHIATMGTITWV